jgi:hypothetical protein
MSAYRVGNYGLAQGYAALVGVVLVVVGLLGFINNPIVGEPANAPLFVTGAVHNIVHIATGLLALYIGFGLSGETQANGLIGLGILYIAVLILTLISPNLFGILGASPTFNVNAADHVLHAALAVVSLGIGYLARGTPGTVATR